MSRHRRFEAVSIYIALACLAAFITTLVFACQYHHDRKTVGLDGGCLVVGMEHNIWGWSAYPDENPLFLRRPYFLRPQTNDWRLYIPIWIPFLIVSIGAIYFHRKARQPRPGHCTKCSYDLAGNISGVCSECGKATGIVQGPSHRPRKDWLGYCDIVKSGNPHSSQDIDSV